MGSPCIILPVVTANPALPTYDWRAIPGLPEYETDAGDHWIFDKGSADNLRGGLSATLLSRAGAAPTYGPNSLTTADGGMNGLVSTFADAATCSWAVVARRAAVPAQPAGNGRAIVASTGTAAADGGTEMLDLTSQIVGRTRQGSSVTMTGASLIGDGTWFFASAACDGVAGRQTYFIGGLAPQTQAVAKTVGARRIGLGNTAINSAGYFFGIEAAELIIWPTRAVPIGEMQAVYARSKIRMGRRGIVTY